MLDVLSLKAHVGNCLPVFGSQVAHRQGLEAHFFSVPLLAAPTLAVFVNDAGSCATAACIFIHQSSPYLLVC